MFVCLKLQHFAFMDVAILVFFVDTCYKIFASDMSWETAEQQCKSLTDGKGQSTLAVIKSSNEHEFIVKCKYYIDKLATMPTRGL